VQGKNKGYIFSMKKNTVIRRGMNYVRMAPTGFGKERRGEKAQIGIVAGNLIAGDTGLKHFMHDIGAAAIGYGTQNFHTDKFRSGWSSQERIIIKKLNNVKKKRFARI
jgi:hypothetical protein